MFFRPLVSAAFLALCAPSLLHAQYFGKNKVHYDEHDFRVLQSEHFDLYYDPADRSAVEIAAQLAERWYTRLSDVLRHEFQDRQPIILYGSQPDFAQTNVVSQALGEDIGGVTESRRRRIVLPFTTGLREFDHVLGHELVHAFQFDIADRAGRGASRMPRWYAEGMAEFLSVGALDPFTLMWIRDAIARDRVPTLDDLTKQRVSPYRYGHAFWTYLAERFGAGLVGDSLRVKPASDVLVRIERLTGLDRETLAKGWEEDLRAVGGAGPDVSRRVAPLLSRRQTGASLHLAPSISPDGRRIAFLSERDGFSIDLYVADARTGEIETRLVSSATDPHFDSLQFSRSAGDWDPAGREFAIAAVRQGQPVLTIFDVDRGRRRREVAFPELGQIFNPSWSPDGRAVAFAGLQGGLSDLYLYDLERRALTRLTDDPFADLQPAWSPDGRRLAFVTDRHTTDLETLAFGVYEPAVLTLETGHVDRVEVATGMDCLDPHWSRSGADLYCVSTYKNGNDIFRVTLDSGVTRRMTDGAIGVSGITPTSPAMSMARETQTLVFSVYRGGGYDVVSIDPATMGDTAVLADRLPGEAEPDRSATDSPSISGAVLRSAADVSRTRSGFLVRDYRSTLALEAIGQPYISSGGGSFGAFLRGGISFSFDDMLRDRLMSVTLQAGTRLRDLGGRVQYLDRDSRWNWGLLAEQMPFARSRLSRHRDDVPGRISVETEQLFQIHRELSGVLLYPFNRSKRFELRAGVSTIAFERDKQVRTYSRATRRLLHEHETTTPGGDPVRLVLAGAALVHDTSVFGATGPILGQRYRLEAAPAIGDVTYVRLLADYRRYIMPVRPFTIATRLLHVGRYGSGADDPRLEPYFVGYPGLVRGYRSRTLRTMMCGGTRVEGCNPLDAFAGSKMVVANLEVRFPLFGLFARRFSYGRWPVEGVAFADAGLAWNGTDTAALFDGSRPLVRSVGAGVRMNAARMIIEVAAARPFGPTSSGWTISLNFGPAF